MSDHAATATVVGPWPTGGGKRPARGSAEGTGSTDQDTTANVDTRKQA